MNVKLFLITLFKGVPIVKMYSYRWTGGSAGIVDSETESAQHGMESAHSLMTDEDAGPTAASGTVFNTLNSSLSEHPNMSPDQSLWAGMHCRYDGVGLDSDVQPVARNVFFQTALLTMEITRPQYTDFI